MKRVNFWGYEPEVVVVDGKTQLLIDDEKLVAAIASSYPSDSKLDLQDYIRLQFDGVQRKLPLYCLLVEVDKEPEEVSKEPEEPASKEEVEEQYIEDFTPPEPPIEPSIYEF